MSNVKAVRSQFQSFLQSDETQPWSDKRHCSFAEPPLRPRHREMAASIGTYSGIGALVAPDRRIVQWCTPYNCTMDHFDVFPSSVAGGWRHQQALTWISRNVAYYFLHHCLCRRMKNVARDASRNLTSSSSRPIPAPIRMNQRGSSLSCVFLCLRLSSPRCSMPSSRHTRAVCHGNHGYQSIFPMIPDTPVADDR